MEIKDIAGLSAPLTRLIEVLEDGCSWTFRPIQMKRIAKSTSKSNSIVSTSEFKAGLKKQLMEDVNMALHNQRERRQLDNIVNIYSIAAQELQCIENIDNTKNVNPEWSAMFFDYAKDVCDEDIQIIWSKLLVEEIKEPNTIFKRTLSVLKELESFEAKWFADLCRYVIEGEWICTDFIKYFEYEHKLSLFDAGLLNSTICGGYIVEDKLDNKHCINFISHIIKWNDPSKKTISFSIYALTDVGKQLYKIQNVKSNYKYVQEFCDQLNIDYDLHAKVYER